MKDAVGERCDPGSDHDIDERHRFRGGRHPVRYGLVVGLRWGLVLAGPLRRDHVRAHIGTHVIGPRRPRNPPT